MNEHRSPRLVALALAVIAVFVFAAPASAAGKPGYPDRVTWNGQSWQVKTSTSGVGPGPCVYSKANATVDAAGNLKLRVARDAGGRWSCAEIIGTTSYGYGTYTFAIASRVDALDPNVVLGLFTWSDKAQYAHREMDVEFARWGNVADPTSAQFVVQPHDRTGHLSRFAQPPLARSIHTIRWQPGVVRFESRESETAAPYAAWEYRGSDVPKLGDERVRLNLWLFEGRAPTDGQPVEVTVERFAFTP